MLTGVFIALIFFIYAMPVAAGEIPPRLQIAPKGRPISGQGMIINLGDPDVAFVVVGTCKKAPFQIGPLVFDIGWETITEEYVSQVFSYVDPYTWPAECNSPANLQGYVLTGFKDLYWLDGIISGEAIMTPLLISSMWKGPSYRLICYRHCLTYSQPVGKRYQCGCWLPEEVVRWNNPCAGASGSVCIDTGSADVFNGNVFF